MSVRHIHIVDDDPAVRDSLAAALEAQGYVVSTYSDAAEFLIVLDRAPAGCLLVDLRMPGMDGLALQQAVRKHGAPLSTIVMTGFGDVPSAVAAMKNGAVDFIEKPVDPDRLDKILSQAFVRVKALDPVLSEPPELAALSPREREVLQQLAHGLSNKQVAQALAISHRTVEVHRARVMEKTQARSLADLVRIALAAGLLSR